jgi:hypothetical protein
VCAPTRARAERQAAGFRVDCSLGLRACTNRHSSSFVVMPGQQLVLSVRLYHYTSSSCLVRVCRRCWRAAAAVRCGVLARQQQLLHVCPPHSVRCWRHLCRRALPWRSAASSRPGMHACSRGPSMVCFRESSAPLTTPRRDGDTPGVGNLHLPCNLAGFVDSCTHAWLLVCGCTAVCACGKTRRRGAGLFMSSL